MRGRSTVVGVRQRWLPYLLPHAVLLTCIFFLVDRHSIGGGFLFAAWAAVVLLDMVLPPIEAGRAAEIQEGRASCLIWKCLVAALVPIYFVLFFTNLMLLLAGGADMFEIFVSASMVGLIGAIFVIPAAHELLHGASRFERGLAWAVFTFFSYPQFCIEHRQGHHRHVGTPRDSATARLGESFYAFFGRSFSWSLMNAWATESLRLEAATLSEKLLRHSLLLGLVALAALYALFYWFAGALGVFVLFLQGVIGFSMLEAINYVQHYGLERRRVGSGVYEATGASHSWNAGHRMSNWLLFDLPQHSLHHAPPRPDDNETAADVPLPQLPFGYFLLLWVALCPPIWRALMDKRAAIWNRRPLQSAGAPVDQRRSLQPRSSLREAL